MCKAHKENTLQELRAMCKAHKENTLQELGNYLMNLCGPPRTPGESTDRRIDSHGLNVLSLWLRLAPLLQGFALVPISHRNTAQCYRLDIGQDSMNGIYGMSQVGPRAHHSYLILACPSRTKSFPPEELSTCQQCVLARPLVLQISG